MANRETWFDRFRQRRGLSAPLPTQGVTDYADEVRRGLRRRKASDPMNWLGQEQQSREIQADEDMMSYINNLATTSRAAENRPPTAEEDAAIRAEIEDGVASGRIRPEDRAYYYDALHRTNLRAANASSYKDNSQNPIPTMKATNLNDAVTELLPGFKGDVDAYLNQALMGWASTGYGAADEGSVALAMKNGGIDPNNNLQVVKALMMANPELAKQLQERTKKLLLNPELRDPVKWKENAQAEKDAPPTETKPAEPAPATAPPPATTPPAATPPSPTPASSTPAPAAQAPVDDEPTPAEIQAQKDAYSKYLREQAQRDAAAAQAASAPTSQILDTPEKRAAFRAANPETLDDTAAPPNPFIRPEGTPLTPNVVTAPSASSQIDPAAASFIGNRPGVTYAAPKPSGTETAGPKNTSGPTPKTLENISETTLELAKAAGASSAGAAAQAASGASDYGAWVQSQARAGAAGMGKTGTAPTPQGITPPGPPKYPSEPKPPKPDAAPVWNDSVGSGKLGRLDRGGTTANGGVNPHNTEMQSRAVTRESLNTTPDQKVQQDAQERRKRLFSVAGSRPGLVY